MSAILIGNVMEWFEVAVYGFVAVNIGCTFFPAGEPTASLLASLAVFTVGVFCPINSAVFGLIGDRLDRREALAPAVIISLTTFILAVLPTYAQIGIWAPIALAALVMLYLWLFETAGRSLTREGSADPGGLPQAAPTAGEGAR
jgi:MFS family permease